MLFNSYIFIFLFLPATLLVYFTLNRLKLTYPAKISLIIASLFFYGYNNPKYVLIIVASIILNYLLCILMRRYIAQRKKIVVLGVVANVLLLGYFKYFDFLIQNINQIFDSSFDYLQIALPLGISFFTFQQISYLVDTSRGEQTGESFVDYVLFVTFFPQLVAGPIVSHDEILPQLASKENKRFRSDNMVQGIIAFSIGLFKKVIVADNLGKIVTYGYQHIPQLNSFEAFLTIIAYTLQIYFDFSGYCDMATGIGLMFNIKLPMNFNSPYKSTTILEFWKRWHITLTRFLTKYIYIPLGGNRKGTIHTYLNIFLVFLISGIWHGAGYTFIIWGILHGLASMLCRVFAKQVSKIPKWINWLLTFIFLNFTWVIFRADSISQAGLLIRRLTVGGFEINEELTETLLQPTFISVPYQFLPFVFVIIVYIVVSLAVCIFCKNTNELVEKKSTSVQSLLATLCLFILSIISLSGVSTFLYFNF